ncbi:MAG: hypothetical protein M3O91_01470 [Chloroflexota bacterium]|nr:hypothetical protein [Chloroflexota bacterium]
MTFASDGDLIALVNSLGRFAWATAQRSPDLARIRGRLAEGAGFKLTWDGHSNTVTVTLVDNDGTRTRIAAFERGAEAWHLARPSARS